MKSPVIQAITKPLIQIQAEWQRDYETAQREYALAKEEHELRRACWKEQFKSASKNNKTAPRRPGDEPGEPKLRRLIVNDATFEALHQIMNHNPAGILVIRDELTGWWSQLDKSGREGERAFSLEAWNGNSSFTVDRIVRGTIHVPNCCMSMLGGIQPGRLRSYLVDAVKDGPGNDGLIQRFQVMVWPDISPHWEYIDRAPDPASGEQATQVFRKLLELDPDNPLRLRFAPDSQELYIEWSTELERKIRRGELHPALISHLSKYRSFMPSLAVLFELADAAAVGRFTNVVSLAHTMQAAAACEYFESHARRVYSCVVSPQLRASHELAEHLKRKQIRNKDGGTDWFAARDVYLKGWSGLDTPDVVRAATSVLEDAGWLRAVKDEDTGGRHATRYIVNPRIWE